ncbi:MAG: DegT/DnrJ/EryC1/StrS family aminotransferase [Planctomycetes bacterium]|nr:DegT/DnrJ/EryC1/StrS family aminotransferase [Planctomycetota bacterium]
MNRRRFLSQTSAGAVGVSLAPSLVFAQKGSGPGASGTLALLGGKPVRTRPFPSWPVIETKDREAWQAVLEQGKWCRLDGNYANNFERAYADLTGTKHCVATANGTSALFASLNALGVGPGDEVLVPPYTFVATINVVLLQHALPIFIDTDRQTFQIDAKKIEAAITPRTACIIPVHLGGNAADLDTILTVAKKRSIPVVEDACQAHLGEWRGRKLGAWGTGGCFSFQASKNLNSGEGGAIISDDADFIERCYGFHNNGRGRRSGGFTYAHGGANLRMTEFQATILLQQMTRVEEQSRIREENAKQLTKLLQEIPGISSARQYEGCTRNAYHLYMFRYERDQFAGASRGQFLKALRAEGIPCSGGYTPLNKEAFLKDTLESKAYQRIYPAERLQAYWDQNHCPENDRLCEEAVWLTQTMLLGGRSDMEEIATAVRKIHENATALAKA